MISIDTNVLVRTIVNDDPIQSLLARNLFETHLPRKQIRIPLIVLTECVWVLRRSYKFSKTNVIEVLKRLLSLSGLSFEREKQVVNAINSWESGSADFTDYLILAVSKADGCDTTYTFEKKKMGRDPRATTLM